MIYKDSAADLRPEAYEAPRLIETEAQGGIELPVYRPEQFDLAVTREDKQSV